MRFHDIHPFHFFTLIWSKLLRYDRFKSRECTETSEILYGVLKTRSVGKAMHYGYYIVVGLLNLIDSSLVWMCLRSEMSIWITFPNATLFIFTIRIKMFMCAYWLMKYTLWSVFIQSVGCLYSITIYSADGCCFF